jgi:hypothetical protein
MWVAARIVVSRAGATKVDDHRARFVLADLAAVGGVEDALRPAAGDDPGAAQPLRVGEHPERARGCPEAAAVERAEDVEGVGGPAQQPLAGDVDADQLGDDAHRQARGEVPRRVELAAVDEAGDDRRRLGVEPRGDRRDRLRPERAHQHPAPGGMRLAVAGEGGLASGDVGQRVGGDAVATDEELVVAERLADVLEAPHRPHPLPRQPDHRSGGANPGEGIGGVRNRRGAVEIEVECRPAAPQQTVDGPISLDVGGFSAHRPGFRGLRWG